MLCFIFIAVYSSSIALLQHLKSNRILCMSVLYSNTTAAPFFCVHAHTHTHASIPIQHNDLWS